MHSAAAATISIASRAGSGGHPQGGLVWHSCRAPPGGTKRKIVSFDTAPECIGPAELAEDWHDDVPDMAESAVFSDASMSPCAQQEKEDDAALAEIEAFADEQARRFVPLIDKRRARRTATVSIGRAKRADGISFQMKSSALWQRRVVTGSGLGALDCVLG